MEATVSQDEVFQNLRSLDGPRESFRGPHQGSGRTPCPPDSYQKVSSVADLPEASKSGNWYIDPLLDKLSAQSEQALETAVDAIEDRSLFAKQLIRHIAISYIFEKDEGAKWSVPYASTLDLQSILQLTISKRLIDEFQEEIFQILPQEIKQWSNNDLERFFGSLISEMDDIEKSIDFINSLTSDELTERAANNALTTFSFVPQRQTESFPLKRLLESPQSTINTFTETLQFLSFSMNHHVREKSLRTLENALRGGLQDKLPVEKLVEEVLKRATSAQSDSSAIVRKAGVGLARQLREYFKRDPEAHAHLLEETQSPSAVSSLLGKSVIRVADLDNRLETNTPLQPEEVRRLFQMFDKEKGIRAGVRRQTAELLNRSTTCAVTVEESFERLKNWGEPEQGDWSAAIARKCFLVSSVLNSQVANENQQEGALKALAQFIEKHGPHYTSLPLIDLAAKHAAGNEGVREALLKALPKSANETAFAALSALYSCDPERSSEIAVPVVKLLHCASHSPNFTLKDTYALITRLGKVTIPELNMLADSKAEYLQRRATAAASALIEAGEASWDDFPKLKELTTQ